MGKAATIMDGVGTGARGGADGMAQVLRDNGGTDEEERELGELGLGWWRRWSQAGMTTSSSSSSSGRQGWSRRHGRGGSSADGESRELTAAAMCLAAVATSSSSSAPVAAQIGVASSVIWGQRRHEWVVGRVG